MAESPASASQGGSTAPGHAVYTPAFLRVYDPLVLRFYSNAVWRCPAPRLVGLYRRHARSRHLDVGPGTGFFLERAGLPADARVTLLDPNPHVLAYASRRLRSLRPVTVRADVCEPLPLSERFDSVALSYVLHCLPGPPEGKALALRNAAAVLEPDGVAFGATVLGEPDLHTPLGRAVLRRLNRQGIFDNHADTQRRLRVMLAESFDDVSVEIVGSVALFAAVGPRRSLSPRAGA